MPAQYILTYVKTKYWEIFSNLPDEKKQKLKADMQRYMERKLEKMR